MNNRLSSRIASKISPMQYESQQQYSRSQGKSWGANGPKGMAQWSQNPESSAQTTPKMSMHFAKMHMCKFELLGICSKGAQCTFAHTQDELRPPPDFSRTKLCKTF